MATDADIQLSDMLESYPSQMTPGFQTILTAKKEFNELASEPTERLPPGRGQYFKHQKMTMRYLRAYDDLILLDEPGTGKSCSVLAFTEFTRTQFDMSKIDPNKVDKKAAHFKRVIVLVKGKTQRQEFKSQLVCKCSDGRYETPTVKHAKNEKIQKRNITTELKNAGYQVLTYTVFANDIAKRFPNESDNEALAQEYSDTIFWVDEAHNLLVDPESTLYKQKQRTYHTIWRLFHLIRRSKRVISTATPMINSENEIGNLMNLILPLNGMIPAGYDYRTAPDNDIRVLFPGVPYDHKTATSEEMAPYFLGQIPPGFNFSTAQLRDIEPFMRGRIAFVRALNTGAIPEEQGAPQEEEYEMSGVIYKSQIVLFTSDMSEKQNAGYLNAKNAERDQLLGDQRQASNFIFPDDFWGGGITEEERVAKRQARKAKADVEAIIDEEEYEAVPLPEEGFMIGGGQMNVAVTEAPKETQRAFRRFVNYVGDTYSPTPEFLPWLQDLQFIRNLSCKYAEICRLVLGEPGNCFIYSEYVVGSGAIVLALCLEGLGAVRYNENRSIFLGMGGNAVKPVCSSSDRTVITRQVRPGIVARKDGGPIRYALLTQATTDTKFQSMMETMNSYENRHGDYIKILISSRVGRDGINVNNVLQIHLIGGEWNESVSFQAMSRGLRATSHDDLIDEEKQRLILLGEDPFTARIKVKIYKHAAVSLDEARNSVDMTMYRFSEYKDRGIKRVMRMMKQVAIGCHINRARNIRPDDIDGSPKCHYDVCDYECYDRMPTEEEKDFSTYDVLYSDEVISEAIDKIINIFRQRNALTINDIANLLPQYRSKYIIMALNNIIISKTRMIDRFGYTTYLREDKGAFYLDRSYPVGTITNYAMSYYTQGIIGIEQESLANLVVQLETGEHQEILSELEKMDPTNPDFNRRLETISIEGQAVILEEAILRELQGNPTPFTTAIINKFQRMIFQINEPTVELNKVYDQLTYNRPKRGRKRNPETKRRTKKINPITIGITEIEHDDTTEIVYLHTLYSQVINQTGYAATARFNKGEGRTRLLKPSEIEDGWRDVNEIELPVYNAYIQIEIAKRNQPFEQQGIYGFILPADKKFRIRDRLTENVGAADDARKIKRGKVCTTWNRPDLIEVMWEIGVQVPGGVFPEFNQNSKPQIVAFLIQKKNINKSREELMGWDLDRLIYYYKWHSATKIKREIICDLIKNRMAATNSLIT